MILEKLIFASSFTGFLKIGLLRLLGQFSSLFLILVLRDISLETLGIYGISVSIISIISSILIYDGTYLVISRNLKPNSFLKNLKLNRIIWVLSLLVLFFYNPLSPEIFVCLLSFIVSLESEYFINIITIGKRSFGNSKLYEKILRIKIITSELILPIITAISLISGTCFWLIIINLVIVIFINLYLLKIAFMRKNISNLSFDLPPIQGVILAGLKKSDSQFYRLLIGNVFGAVSLGAIYPALVIGRIGSIIGNTWYSFYFKDINSMTKIFSQIWKFKWQILFLILPITILYSLIAEKIVQFFFNWSVEILIYAVFFIINIQFFSKTVLRSFALNQRQQFFFNLFIFSSLLARYLMLSFFDVSLSYSLVFCVVCDAVLIMFMFRTLLIKSKKLKSGKKSILRVTALPTMKFPASGLTSHELVEKEDDLIALPFPQKYCLFNYDKKKLVLESKFNLLNKKVPRFIRFLMAINFSFKISRYVIENKISIVHIHWIPLIFISIFLPRNVKLFLTIHGEDARHLKYYFLKKITHNFKKIFVVGSYWKKKLIDYNIYAEEIPNFTSLITNENNETNLQKNKITICMVGSEKKHKNFEIFRNIDNSFWDTLKKGTIKVDIVGITEKYLIGLGINHSYLFNFYGRCSRKTTLNIIQKSDLLLLPSYTEGNPKVIWEAVQLGTVPVISNTITFLGFKDKIYPFTFNPYDPKDFWETVQLSIQNFKNFNTNYYFKVYTRNDVRKLYDNAYLR